MIKKDADFEQQEHLSLKRLKQFKASKNKDLGERPKENFLDLMGWVETHFKSHLSDQAHLHKMVHNRIIVDGQFLQFCEEQGITVEPLYEDAIVSWKTDRDFERFFVQGIFLIKKDGLEFLHSALFHKGNNYEDEISFFVIVSEKNHQGYLELRNKFDAWAQERDRSNSFIRVIGGDDLPYDKEHTWNDLFLPTGLKTEIKNAVEGFLGSRDFYLKNRIPWKMGLLLWGSPGCGKTSLIRTLISSYNFKPITIVPHANDEILQEAFFYAEEQSPSLLYFEDLDSLLERSIDPSSFLNLVDGVSSRDGLLIVATANDVKRLKSNITDRPSRFDRKFEIPLPTQEMAATYLKRWFDGVLPAKKIKEISKYAEKNAFSYAYLKELYISAMFEALSHGRKSPTEKDVNCSLQRIIRERHSLGKTPISMDRYQS